MVNLVNMEDHPRVRFLKKTAKPYVRRNIQRAKLVLRIATLLSTFMAFVQQNHVPLTTLNLEGIFLTEIMPYSNLSVPSKVSEHATSFKLEVSLITWDAFTGWAAWFTQSLIFIIMCHALPSVAPKEISTIKPVTQAPGTDTLVTVAFLSACVMKETSLFPSLEDVEITYMLNLTWKMVVLLLPVGLTPIIEGNASVEA